MRIGFYSTEYTSMFAWRRLQDEGFEVAVYFAPAKPGIIPTQTFVGDGIVKKLGSVRELSEWVGKNGAIVFDGSGHGDKADALRSAGHLVFCGGSFCDKLEAKRAYAEDLAQQAGVECPPTTPFSTITSAINFVKKNEGKKFYFKSNTYLESSATTSAKSSEGLIEQLDTIRKRFGDFISCILQEKIEGVAFSTAFWWNGKTIVGPLEGTVEHKKFMNDDVGPATGCSVNLVWFYNTWPRIASELKLEKIEEVFRKENAPPCLYDINAIVTPEGRCYFLEWTPRFGYDSEPTSQQLLTGSLGETYIRLAAGRIEQMPVLTMDQASAYSIRLSVSPYPWEHSEDRRGKKTCVGTPVRVEGAKLPTLWKQFIGYGLRLKDGRLEVADPYGLVGLAATKGTNLESMHKYCLNLIDKMDIKDLQYRTDGAAVIAKDLKAVRKSGYEVPRV